jgi:ParB family chromosome partitioning protein
MSVISKKAEAMMGSLGGNIDESIGAGGQGTLAGPHFAVARSPRQGLERMKGAFLLSPQLLKSDPDQPRKTFGAAEMDGMMRSITSRGILQPIRVRWDEAGQSWVIVAGERRWRAASLLGMDKVPCIEAPDATPDEILIDQLTENCMREDLDPMQQARAFQVLIDRTGITQGELAERMGMSASTVSRSLQLLSLPSDVQEAVSRGEIGVAAAYEKVKELPVPEATSDATPGEVRKLATRRARRSSGPKTTRHEYRDQASGFSVVVSFRRPDAGPRDFERALRAAIADLKKAAS